MNIQTKLKCLLFTTALMVFSHNHLYSQDELPFPVVDTKQVKFYNTLSEIEEPLIGQPFYGQDANYSGLQPAYEDNGDGTVTDLVSGLMWQKSPDMDGNGVIDYADKMSYNEALAAADTFGLAGYDDWRLPNIKEMYSLIVFSGIDPSGYEGNDTEDLVPFIDTDYFDFAYGDTDAGERIIDAQMASSTLYVGTTMNGDETMFGVNFADGRIKGYPTGPMPGQEEDKQFYVMYVRDNVDYGINDFVDNGDGTITDNATGLMWMQNDDGEGMDWEDALSYAEGSVFANYNDWRLPNAKELQSIVDYSRAPSVTNSAAIDPVFNCSTITDEGGNEDYPFYWSGTTHTNWSENNSGAWAAYVCFGTAFGFMEIPPGSGNFQLMDVHGAGAQRSDPKVGDPDEYPYGHGPQGDVVRIYNYVRLVRDAESTTGLNERKMQKDYFKVYPNPATDLITVELTGETIENVSIQVLNVVGEVIYSRKLKTEGKVSLQLNEYQKGVYFIKVRNGRKVSSKKFIKN